ncbi:MAG: imidazoleglycerol-phosphate dehydratase [Spirochaetales bacterium]|nr:imidazoleglycerol-phosphate dehydratase [Spirochaetales bacterium]
MSVIASTPASGSVSRAAAIERVTRETRVVASLVLEPGAVNVATGVGFLDHLLATLAFHARWTLELRADGDLQVDEHHTAEDSALVLGTLLDRALGERAGIRRFGSAHACLDEALARAVVDLGGRPWCETSLELVRPAIGALAAENIAHVVRSFATNARAAVHLDVLRGGNDHHKAEAAFKALALALREALALDPMDAAGGAARVPSLKGTLA